MNAASYETNCSMFHSRWDSTVSSLELQWLGLHVFSSKGTDSNSGQGTKIPQALWHVPKKDTTVQHACLTIELSVNNLSLFKSSLGVICLLHRIC